MDRWLQQTTTQIVRCRTIPELLDLAYDAIREGLDFDRVGVLLLDQVRRALVLRIGTDAQGGKFYPVDRIEPLRKGTYNSGLLADPRMGSEGPGFVYRADAMAETAPAERPYLDGEPRGNLLVALRTADAVLGFISVDNLTTGRPIGPADAPPLVAFAGVTATTMENIALLEEREQRIASLDADLRHQMEQLRWMQEATRQVNAAHTLRGVLDVVYDSIHEGLDYDRVGVNFFDHAAGIFEEVMGTDDAGGKIWTNRTVTLADDSAIWRFPGITALLQGAEFYYTAAAYEECPSELRHLFDGQPTHNVMVSLRSGEQVTGMISVDNLTSGRPILPEQVGPLLALARQVSTAIERARLLEREHAEGVRLAASAQSLRAVMATMACGVVVVTPAGLIADANTAAQQILGQSLDQLRGQPTDKALSATIRENGAVVPEAERPVAGALRTRQPQHGVVMEALLPGGQRRWLQVDAVPLLDAEGMLLHLVVSFIDITAGKQVEEALLVSEQHYRQLFEQANDAILLIDPVGEIVLDMNARAATLYGVTREAFLGTSLKEISQDVHRGDHELHKLIAAGISQEFETVQFRADGTPLYLAINAALIEVGGHPVILSVNRDTTARKQAEEALRTSEQKFRLLFADSPQPMWVYDVQTLQFLEVNEAALACYGYTRAEFLAMGIADIRPPEDVPRVLESICAARPGLRQAEQWRHRLKDGRLINVEITAHTVPFGGRDAVLVLASDVTARTRAEQALQESEAYFRALSEQATDLVLVVESAGTIRDASPSHQRILGYTPEEIEGTSVFEEIHPEDLAQVQADFAATRQTPGTMHMGELRWRHADGSWRTLDSVTNNRLRDPAVQGIIINSRDITERKRAEETLTHQALHDALTGLPNRVLLADRLAQALLAAHRTGTSLALLLLDLDHFKEVNDTLGHAVGDLLLQDVAARMHAALRSADTVARLGGDEFAVLLPTADIGGAIRAAETLLAALETPVSIEDHRFTVEVSIGIAAFPTDGSDAATLLRHADVAMYVAKQGHLGYAAYSADEDRHTSSRLGLLNDLRESLAQDHLVLYYQPKVHIATERPWGVEALLRWPHPQRGFIPPDQFIPLAEQTGIMGPLTHWVLETGLRQCRAWNSQGQPLNVAINLSTRTLHDQQFPQTVTTLLRQYDLAPAQLTLEITESALMSDPARALEVLTHLAGLGVRLSIDDFGTGYSSLGYLKRLPVHEVKIDKSFVLAMGSDPKDAAIVHAVIVLAHALDLEVVAEGVEDQATWDLLACWGCDSVQGYYMSRPLPAGQVQSWVGASPGR